MGIEFQTNGIRNDFVDSDEISDYAREAVYRIKEIGIIDGVGENRFNPKGLCTRAMAAKIIDLLLQKSS